MELPVWVVHGNNWEAEVPLDEFNSQFTQDIQASEAGTKAIAAFKGRDNGIVIKLDDGETEPFVGTTIIVHLKNTEPRKGFVPYTHTLLANDGYYLDSIAMQAKLQEQLDEIKKVQMQEALAAQALQQQLQGFDALRRDMLVKLQKPAKPAKKTRKKGIDKGPKPE